MTQRITTSLPLAAECALRVAIVIPTYNHAAFLAEALQSALAQLRAPDEIIVVDDGSEDEPENVVKQFPAVRLIRQSNGGLSAARNTGLFATQADKVIFLDADDLLHACAVEAGLSAFCLAPDAGFVYGAHRRIDGNDSVLEAYRYSAIGPEPYADLLQGNAIGMHATVMYDRRKLQAAGGFDPALGKCEDYDVYLRLSRTCGVASHPAVVADYRWHGGNMSSNRAEMLAWALRVHDRQRKHARERAETHKAWQCGRRNWKHYYVEDTLRSLKHESPLQVLSDAAFALRTSPALTLKRLAGKAQRRLFARGGPFRKRWPPRVGAVDFGDLGSTEPISRDFGFDRGTPIDRYYIEAFLERHASDIRGRALEVGDASYCRRFGGSAITQQDVLHVSKDAAAATIVGDLAQAGVLPEAAFDCMVLTQTLHLIYDLRAALAQVHRALRPGAVVLLTVPGISQLDRGVWNDTWSWSLTPYSLRRLCAEFFAENEIEIASHGNVFAATAFLQGLSLEEVSRKKLDQQDSVYPVIVTVRARKGRH